MNKATNNFAPEVRERAVRMVLHHERDTLHAGQGRLRQPRSSAACHLGGMNGRRRPRSKRVRRNGQWLPTTRRFPAVLLVNKIYFQRARRIDAAHRAPA